MQRITIPVKRGVRVVGILLLAMVPIDHKRELEIQAAIEAKHGSKKAESFIS